MKLRNVTLHQLRLFQSLAKHLNYTRVAEELHLTQPAVSIQIKRLEESMGLPLVEQKGKRLFLTEAGREMFEACRDVLDRLRVLDEDMSSMEAGVQGPLTIAAITTAKYFMPHLLGAFLRDYPAVEPRLTITNQARVMERLDQNLDDMVIMGTLPQDMNIESQYFLDNPLVVVAPPDHPLAGKRNIPLAHIADERYLVREPGSGTRMASTKLFADHGQTAKIYMELGSTECIKQAVMAGLGISVLSSHNIQLERDAGLIAVLDVEHFPLERQWYAVHMKNKRLSNTASIFLDFLLRDGARIWEEVQPHIIKTHTEAAGKRQDKTSRRKRGSPIAVDGNK